MKMNFRSLSLAALLLSASGSAMADQGTTSSVGDLPGYRSESAAYESMATDDGSTSVLSDAWSDDFGGDLQQTTFDESHPAMTGPFVGSAPCRSSSHRSACGTGRRMNEVFSGGDRWVQAEMLLWFPQARSSPGLITTAPIGTAPTLDNGAAVAFGGQSELDGGLSGGFRIDAGKYLTKNFGIGGRFWILHENAINANLADDGTNLAIGRPFFNTGVPGQDALLISQGGGAGTTPAAGDFAGSVSAESSLRIWAAELYGRLRFGGGSNFQTDFIAGYSHFDIDDLLTISSATVQTNPATAETWLFNDSFDAANEFNGGQLGFESVVTQGKWSLRTLTKVHLGNMRQTVRTAGSSSNFIPPATPTSVPFGALALDASGTNERDVFTFAPEANLKLAYRFRENVSLSVGYTFIYWGNVAQAGDYVDPQFDGSTLATAGPHGQQLFTWRDSSLWTQGIDLGFVLDF